MPATQHVITKEVKSNPKQPSCKKVCAPEEGHCEKRGEIQGGNQDMAVMANFFYYENLGEFGAKS